MIYEKVAVHCMIEYNDLCLMSLPGWKVAPISEMADSRQIRPTANFIFFS